MRQEPRASHGMRAEEMLAPSVVPSLAGKVQPEAAGSSSLLLLPCLWSLEEEPAAI